MVASTDKIELTLDSDLLRKAAAQAIVMMLGDDPTEVLERFVSTVLSSNLNQYGSRQERTVLERLLFDEIEKAARAIITDWIAANPEVLAVPVLAAFEAQAGGIAEGVAERIAKPWLKVPG